MKKHNFSNRPSQSWKKLQLGALYATKIWTPNFDGKSLIHLDISAFSLLTFSRSPFCSSDQTKFGSKIREIFYKYKISLPKSSNLIHCSQTMQFRWFKDSFKASPHNEIQQVLYPAYCCTYISSDLRSFHSTIDWRYNSYCHLPGPYPFCPSLTYYSTTITIASEK